MENKKFMVVFVYKYPNHMTTTLEKNYLIMARINGLVTKACIKLQVQKGRKEHKFQVIFPWLFENTPILIVNYL